MTTRRVRTCISLPGEVNSRGINGPKLRDTVIAYTSNNGEDTKGTNSSTLGVLLLDRTNSSGNILNRRSIFSRQTVRLALETSLVNEHSRIGTEAGESKGNVVVNANDLLQGTIHLKNEKTRVKT